jgi:hypothetical protein
MHFSIDTPDGLFLFWIVLISGLLTVAAILILSLYFLTRGRLRNGKPRNLSLREWLTGRTRTKKGKTGAVADAEEIDDSSAAPKWLVWFVFILLVYQVAGAIICGSRIYQTYPRTCNAVKNCVDQTTAMMLWPVYLYDPKDMSAAAKYFGEFMRAGRSNR